MIEGMTDERWCELLRELLEAGVKAGVSPTMLVAACVRGGAVVIVAALPDSPPEEIAARFTIAAKETIEQVLRDR